MTAPTVTVSNPSTLSGSAVRALVAWTGTDHAGGSGILLYRLDRSVNGGAWTTVQNLSVSTSTQVLTVGAAYRFRVQAIDHDRNVSGTAYGITIKARLTQQTSSAVHFTSTWSASSSTSYSGGSVRWSKVAGASASYTATGRSYAIVATRAPARGKARIYVNGVLKATIDLGTMATTYRAQVWSIRYSTSASRTIKIVVAGTSGRPRVDLDAFVVLY